MWVLVRGLGLLGLCVGELGIWMFVYGYVLVGVSVYRVGTGWKDW